MKLTKLIEKPQNFRLLPVFVLTSMVIGVGVGKLYGISNFELTPPLDDIKASFCGFYTFTLSNTLARGKE
jgi:ACR3 family arsenite transporter